MKIKIKNWEKFNPRKDIKSTSWFRMNNDFFIDPKFFNLTSDEKMIWITLLCQSSQKYSDEFETSFKLLAALIGIEIEFICNTIKKLEAIGVITVSSWDEENAFGFGPYERTNEHNERTKRTKHTIGQRPIKQENVEPQKKNPENFDLEYLYQAYPRKVGKKKGIEKLKRIIKSKSDYEKFKTAILNYSRHVMGQEDKFIKHFSSFVSVWEDFLEISENELRANGPNDPNAFLKTMFMQSGTVEADFERK